MRAGARLRAVFVCFLFAGTAGAELPTIPQELERATTLFDAAGFYDEIPGLFSNTAKCLARGFSAAVCDEARTICAINIAAGTVFSPLQTLLDAFQTDCGNGICFACCFTGERCHTSFFDPDYEPVINCVPGAGYGPIAFQAGPTLVVDPDAQPGDACLFVGQTCDHLPLCLSGRSPQDIQRINDNPQHVMKSDAAVKSRARTFASSMLANWSGFLSGYHTSVPEQSDGIRTRVRDFSAIGSFVTGRGCTGWRSRFAGWRATDWSDPSFRIVDEDGVFAEEASHYNGLRILGVAQLVASVPNVYQRLAYVESRIWTPEAIRQYLAPVADPEAALLRTMSPLALEILKRNQQLQDYRLLAVPLPGESVPPRFYNGCTLGEPSNVQMSYRKRGSLGIELQIATTPGVDALALWGDGGVTRVVVPASGSVQLTHDYAAGGRYQVLLIAQNDTGLKTVAALVAETLGQGTSAANAPLPVVSEVQLVDLRATMDANAGNTMRMLFELEGWTSPDQGHALGISRALQVPQGQTVAFGTLAGWNAGAAPLRSVTIRPSRYGQGVIFGFRRNFFTVDRVRIGVYSTERNRLRFYDVLVTPEMVRLYAQGSDTPVALTNPTYAANGRLEIPVQVGSTRYSRIDLLLPQSLFTRAVQAPVTDPAWRGFTGTYGESVPDDEVDLETKRRPVRR